MHKFAADTTYGNTLAALSVESILMAGKELLPSSLNLE